MTSFDQKKLFYTLISLLIAWQKIQYICQVVVTKWKYFMRILIILIIVIILGTTRHLQPILKTQTCHSALKLIIQGITRHLSTLIKYQITLYWLFLIILGITGHLSVNCADLHTQIVHFCTVVFKNGQWLYIIRAESWHENPIYPGVAGSGVNMGWHTVL